MKDVQSSLDVQRFLLWDLWRLPLLPLSFEGKASQQGVSLAEGHRRRSRAPQWAPLPA